MIVGKAAKWLWSRSPFLQRLVDGVLVRRGRPAALAGDLDADITTVMDRSRTLSDISDHLLTIHAEASEVAPRLIVELGTRGGESTSALLRVARRTGGAMVSVDISDCATSAADPAWRFLRADDIELAPRFADWARSQGLPTAIDVLFIDTSHEYQHTCDELAAWAPMVPAGGKIILHDTNLRDWFRRRDGSLGSGWDNARGVTRALEEFLGIRFDERRALVTIARGWLIRHHPESNGLTVLRRLEAVGAGAGA